MGISRVSKWSSVLLALLGCVALPLAAAATDDSAPAAASGKMLYEARCAGCHDRASDRTPSRDILAHNPPTFILNAMRAVMAPMAAGLSEDEMKAIALFLSTAAPQPGDPNPYAIWGPSSAEMPLDGPQCGGRPPPIDLSDRKWNGWSPRPDNARYQPDPGFTVADVPRLRVKWAFHYAGSKNGQATVIGNRLYVTSMSGAVYALDARSGCVYWRFDSLAATRSSVSIGPIANRPGHRYALYFSDWTKSAVAIDAETGEPLWRTKVDDSSGLQMTGSPTLYNGVLLVPISTGNEAFARNDDYDCCKFIGSLVALDANSGEILWKTYTTNKKPAPYRMNTKGKPLWGPSGGSIWSAPTIDPARDLIYVATSNSHTDAFHDGADSVIAMDFKTGAIRWKNQLLKDDNYIIGCPAAANCPHPVGPDFALGDSVILHTFKDGRQMLIAGQKSGDVYALDPDADGKIIWRHRLSSGSALGGVEFGSAADDDNVYVGISDVANFRDPKPGLTAIRIADGKILWNTPAPKTSCRWTNIYCSGAISMAVTVIPGAVFAASMDGHFRAYATANGNVIWDFNTAAEAINDVLDKPAYGGVMDGAGPTIVNGIVYVHSGYAGRSTANIYDLKGKEGNLLIAFSVDGR
ncbi:MULTISPECIES: PQQ-binding-like beta-propeller repeat protein [unclassified Bradyrhizobium]|uniref:outer membrane protein assembly factor BamB family protein n=1 Tax=unclassified Bradyrhizobium TaxID=2631580 RepID=UPI0028EAC7F6|nr:MULTISPECIES: PQQ-binding-like beta-propeller repeat protein [unclassified Bradyrhizobium]